MKVLVVGAAKTGTTIISKTIQNSLQDAYFHMEPQDAAFFMEGALMDRYSRVVKIIFEHWSQRPNLRKAIIANELPFQFDKTVVIIRDPRDEMLSRVMYFVYPWLEENGYKGNESQVDSWLKFIEQVERNPSAYSFKQIIAFLHENFSVSVFSTTHPLAVYRDFCEEVKKDACLVRYEDFILGNYEALEKYLGVSLATESGLDYQHRTRRSAAFNNWKPLFKEEDNEYFRNHLGGVMEKQGYTDWNLEPVSMLPSDNYSGYLWRIVADYRVMEEENQVNEKLPSGKKSFFGFLRK